MLSSMLSQLQSRVTEYPGFSSLRSDATRFHETATGAHETSQFLVIQTWVTGEAFQSMIRDFDDIDRIRHELNLVPTTEVASSSATTTPIDSRNPNSTATPTVSSKVGTDFTGFPFDHHSTHTAASSYVQPFNHTLEEMCKILEPRWYVQYPKKDTRGAKPASVAIRAAPIEKIASGATFPSNVPTDCRGPLAQGGNTEKSQDLKNRLKGAQRCWFCRQTGCAGSPAGAHVPDQVCKDAMGLCPKFKKFAIRGASLED
jgi:hypothetical protein